MSPCRLRRPESQAQALRMRLPLVVRADRDGMPTASAGVPWSKRGAHEYGDVCPRCRRTGVKLTADHLHRWPSAARRTDRSPCCASTASDHRERASPTRDGGPRSLGIDRGGEAGASGGGTACASAKWRSPNAIMKSEAPCPALANAPRYRADGLSERARHSGTLSCQRAESRRSPRLIGEACAPRSRRRGRGHRRRRGYELHHGDDEDRAPAPLVKVEREQRQLFAKLWSSMCHLEWDSQTDGRVWD